MRAPAVLSTLGLALCLATGTAAASETYPRADDGLRLEDGARALPGDAVWPLAERRAPGARLRLEDGAQGGFRLAYALAPGAAQAAPAPRACLGLESAVRLDLYKTRAVELRVRASRPVAGILVITTSNTQDRAARDRFFGAFVIGREWKTLRLPYGTLAPLPGWDAVRSGLRTGDNVLRPDSVEELCIGAEAGRLSPQPPGAPGEELVVEIGSLRFVR